ncbi:MAG: hypothetical protein PHQ54_04480 [Candidatus Omnitrophica bacterium]|nr:hypothetical protein [Candidatus Omnitrophota bacterium]
MDLLFIIFLIFFWVLSNLLKKPEKTVSERKKYYEKDLGIFRLPELNIPIDFIQPEEKFVQTEPTRVSTPKAIEKQKTVKTEKIKQPLYREPGISWKNMLKSKTSLQNSFILKEILDKPVSLR